MQAVPTAFVQHPGPRQMGPASLVVVDRQAQFGGLLNQHRQQERVGFAVEAEAVDAAVGLAVRGRLHPLGARTTAPADFGREAVYQGACQLRELGVRGGGCAGQPHVQAVGFLQARGCGFFPEVDDVAHAQ